MKLLYKLIIVLSFCLKTCGSADSAKNYHLPSKINAENLESVLIEYRSEYNIPALVLGVFTPDTIIITEDGINDIISKRKIDPSDRFHIGSCTKAITAFMAARLIEKNFLSWDSKILDIFPEWEQEMLNYYKAKHLLICFHIEQGYNHFSMVLNSRMFQ